jgi:probable HAF family extracellular repeat protein
MLGGVSRKLSRTGLAAVMGITGVVLPLRSPSLPMRFYTVVDLGTLGGEFSSAQAVNNRGEVVGQAMTLEGVPHAFRTQPNQPINSLSDDLGAPGPSSVQSIATAINNRGQVALCTWVWQWHGKAPEEGTPPRSRAFRIDGPSITDLGALDVTSFEARRSEREKGLAHGHTGANRAHIDFVTIPPVPRDGTTVGFCPEDRRRVLAAPSTAVPAGLRGRALFAVLACTSCQVGELARLRDRDYKSTSGHGNR